MKKICLILLVLISLSNRAFCQDNEKILYTLGTSGAGVAYNTFQLLNLMYDGLASECSSAEYVQSDSAGQIGLLEVIQNSYQDLYDSETLADPNDQMYVQRLLEIVTLLREQAELLNSLAVEWDEAESEAYIEKRDAAWVRISHLLGLNSDSQ